MKRQFESHRNGEGKIVSCW